MVMATVKGQSASQSASSQHVVVSQSSGGRASQLISGHVRFSTSTLSSQSVDRPVRSVSTVGSFSAAVHRGVNRQQL